MRFSRENRRRWRWDPHAQISGVAPCFIPQGFIMLRTRFLWSVTSLACSRNSATSAPALLFSRSTISPSFPHSRQPTHLNPAAKWAAGRHLNRSALFSAYSRIWCAPADFPGPLTMAPPHWVCRRYGPALDFVLTDPTITDLARSTTERTAFLQSRQESNGLSFPPSVSTALFSGTSNASPSWQDRKVSRWSE
ncbi:hypothetical protein ACVIU7_002852 [Bradyrhizobium liaoningense]